jgi:hypothetical protein
LIAVQRRTRADRLVNARPSGIPAAFRSRYRPEEIEYRDLGRMDAVCPKCGAKHWIGERIAESSATDPRFNLCCSNGAVVLPPNRDPPPQMQNLWESDQPHAVRFRENARRYNTQLAFTSCRFHEDGRVSGYRPFGIHGEMYHLQGPLENDPGIAP